MQDMIRQGDVLLRPCRPQAAQLTPVPTELGRVVLAHGEVTGHHHSLALSPRVAMFRDDGGGSGGRTYLQVTGDTPLPLEHQEHTALAVTPGVHEVVRQRTYQAGMAARVAD